MSTPPPIPRRRTSITMPEIAQIKERLDNLITQRREDRDNEEQFRERLSIKLDKILSQVTATNGRVNAHDVVLAALASLPDRVTALERALERSKGALAAYASAAGILGALAGWLAKWLMGGHS